MHKRANGRRFAAPIRCDQASESRACPSRHCQCPPESFATCRISAGGPAGPRRKPVPVSAAVGRLMDLTSARSPGGSRLLDRPRGRKASEIVLPDQSIP